MQSQNGFKVFLVIIVSFVLLAGCFSGGVVTGWLIPLHSNKSQAISLAVEQPVPAATLPAAPLVPTDTRTAVPAPSVEPTFTPTPAPAAPSDGTPSPELNALLAPFWEAWKLVHQQYVDQPLNDQKLIQGAIRGMLDSLGDPHTSYMNPDEYRLENSSLQGDYEGIGAYVDPTGKYLSIISPMPGSPAEKAGLKAGDIIQAVDGKDVTGMTGNAVILLVLGPAGSKVTLSILRDGVKKPFDVVITRAKITVASVQSKMLDKNIAYVQISIFGDTTGSDLHKTLTDIMAKNPSGLIIDLRNNGGGYLTAAIQVASEFIPTGIVLYEKYGDGSRQSHSVLPGGLATKIPLVVLVNQGTASASEIVSGAIQDDQRGKLVGVKTYGKGSVQLVSSLENNQGAVRITIAHWLTPKGNLIDKIGLQPDVEVPLTDDDINAKKDPQLDKAVELLTQNK